MNVGTKNAGISTHGNVAIAADPGVSKLKRSSEPGAEPTPSVTAVTRSARPKAFQIPAIQPQPGTRRWTAHATGSAVAPATMSPQPAECANDHGRRPAEKRRRNITPAIRPTFTATSVAIGR